MSRKGLLKCRNCERFFVPDLRNAWHQHYCGEPECRQASSAASRELWHAHWPAYFRGREQTQRVQNWRAENPYYWRRSKAKARKDAAGSRSAPADVILPQLPALDGNMDGINEALVRQISALQYLVLSQHHLLVGLTAMITRHPFKQVMAKTLRRWYIRGRDLCSSMPGLSLEEICHGPQARSAPGAPAPGAGTRGQSVRKGAG